MPRTLEIHIEKERPIEVGPTVSRYRQDQLEWFWDTHPNPNLKKVEIIFVGPSPFVSGTFTIPPGGSVRSGPVGPSVATKTFYKYTVKKTYSSGATEELDPKVFVDD